MEKLPFTSFDFWSYLASGFLLLCAFDSAFAYGLLGRKDWNVVEGVLAVSVAYVTGHVIASLSSLFLERGLVGKVLGRPSAGLFGKSKARKWVQKFFILSYYYEELPKEEIARNVLASLGVPFERAEEAYKVLTADQMEKLTRICQIEFLR